MEIFNVYCDESCHLENDHQKAMVLGAVWCPLEKIREISVRLREIKKRHGLPSDFEVKWTKISPAKALPATGAMFNNRKNIITARLIYSSGLYNQIRPLRPAAPCPHGPGYIYLGSL